MHAFRLGITLVPLFATTLACTTVDSSEGGRASGTAAAASSNVSEGSSETLTAGAWDDNRNFEQFLSFRTAHQGVLPLDEATHRAAHDALPAPAAKQLLDVVLMVDTTGSMGDELEYLRAEFHALHDAIASRYPNAQQRWGLVSYKDVGDTYVTRPVGLRDDPGDFQSQLDQQSADGGGDYPEAPDQGLAAVNGLSWRDGAANARLVFWIADAPAHSEQAGAMADAIKDAAAKGLHIYPVAASGVDVNAELMMRSAAQMTGGRYLFLTDDSGVGDSHAEPSVPCYFVTTLKKQILRMVDIEMTGIYREPDAADVIRTGGDPHNGACMLSNGQQVNIY